MDWQISQEIPERGQLKKNGKGCRNSQNSKISGLEKKVFNCNEKDMGESYV